MTKPDTLPVCNQASCSYDNFFVKGKVPFFRVLFVYLNYESKFQLSKKNLLHLGEKLQVLRFQEHICLYI